MSIQKVAMSIRTIAMLCSQYTPTIPTSVKYTQTVAMTHHPLICPSSTDKALCQVNTNRWNVKYTSNFDCYVRHSLSDFDGCLGELWDTFT